MSIMDNLRQYFGRFPELADKRLNLDCLASDPDSYSIDSVPSSSSALSLAARMATIRAFCSLQKLSTNAP